MIYIIIVIIRCRRMAAIVQTILENWLKTLNRPRDIVLVGKYPISLLYAQKGGSIKNAVNNLFEIKSQRDAPTYRISEITNGWNSAE